MKGHVVWVWALVSGVFGLAPWAVVFWCSWRGDWRNEWLEVLRIPWFMWFLPLPGLLCALGGLVSFLVRRAGPWWLLLVAAAVNFSFLVWRVVYFP
jgi:hypothetical protein